MLIICYSHLGLGVGVEKITVVRCTQTHKVLENVWTISTREIMAFWRKVAGLVTCREIINIFFICPEYFSSLQFQYLIQLLSVYDVHVLNFFTKEAISREASVESNSSLLKYHKPIVEVDL